MSLSLEFAIFASLSLFPVNPNDPWVAEWFGVLPGDIGEGAAPREAGDKSARCRAAASRASASFLHSGASPTRYPMALIGVVTTSGVNRISD